VAWLTSAIRNRLLPAVLTATGVSLIAAGLLTYSAPVEAAPGPSSSADIAADTPVPSFALPTLPPVSSSASPTPSPSASAPADRVATRVVVKALKIDLPIIAQPNASYPACNVAMYLDDPGLGQPGQGRSTYLYAHARDGMFGPIYHLAIEKRTPNAMVGMLVQVYTSDDQLFEYFVTEVRLHQKSLSDAIGATSELLWLQTSEGPRAPPGVVTGKTQVIAQLFTVGPANHADAHPKPHPVNCG
jgi:sortase family protein